ncbi:MAG: hypothetical protein WD155_00320 [Burkholderiales bacterium]
MLSPDDMLWQLLFRFFIAVVLVFAAVGLAAGIGLIVASARILRVFAVMNRWISTRGAFKALDVPRSTERFSHGNRRWIGGALIAGGLFAALGLVIDVNTGSFSAAFASGDMAKLLAIAAETLKWFLIVGSVAGVAVGAMLCFFPDALVILEKYANWWVSTRRVVHGGDDVHLTLERLVEAHPGPSGWILACTTLGAGVYALTLLLARH